MEESPTANPSAVAMSVPQLLRVSLSAAGFLLSTPLYWGHVKCLLAVLMCGNQVTPIATSSHTAGNVQFTLQIAFPPHRWLQPAL